MTPDEAYKKITSLIDKDYATGDRPSPSTILAFGRMQKEYDRKNSNPPYHFIHLAAAEGNLRALRFFRSYFSLDATALQKPVPFRLRSHKPELLRYDEKMENTPLICAAFWGQVDATRYLLKEGALPQHTDSGNMTALHHVMQRGHAACLDVFIAESSAAIETMLNSRGEYAHTPFQTLLQSGGFEDFETRKEMALSALAAGASLSLPDRDGNAPLGYILSDIPYRNSQQRLEMLQIFRRFGADDYIRANLTNPRMQPLWIFADKMKKRVGDGKEAISDADQTIVDILLRLGCNPDIAPEQVETPRLMLEALGLKLPPPRPWPGSAPREPGF